MSGHLRATRVATPLIALAVALGACGSPKSQDGGASDGPGQAKTVSVSIASDEGTLTPFTNETGYPGANIVRLLFDTLVVLDPQNQVKPLLARELRTEDGKVYTLPLRTGVTWHDGRPFTAQDVVFSLEYYKKHSVGDSAIDVRGLKTVTADGDTVTITLDKPDPEFPVRTLSDAPMLPRHLWEKLDDPQAAGTELAVGTGPYKLTTYDRDRGYTLNANPSYALGKPKVGTIRLAVIPEKQTQIAALRTGEIQMAANAVLPQQADQLKGQRGIEVTDGPDFASTLLAFNTGRAPLDRAEVRRALAKAIDVQALVDTVLLGKGTVGNPGHLNPQGPIKVDPLRHTFDPQAAARELDALGATPGSGGTRVLGGKPMSFELLVQSTSPDRVRAAEMIREMFGKVGVSVSVKSMDPDSLDAKVWPGYDVRKGREYDMTMWGWSSPTMFDTTKIASLVASGPDDGRLNVVGLKDAEVDRTVAELLAATTMDARTAAAKKLQTEIADKLPFVTLYYRKGLYAYRKDAYNGWVYQTGVGIMNKFSFVQLNLA